MAFALKPDYDQSAERYRAFWERAATDRPLVGFRFPVRDVDGPPEKQYASLKERWLDVKYRADSIAADLERYEYLGDALPVAWPNMGPEIFSVW